jgi:hypothetical protein
MIKGLRGAATIWSEDLNQPRPLYCDVLDLTARHMVGNLLLLRRPSRA